MRCGTVFRYPRHVSAYFQVDWKPSLIVPVSNKRKQAFPETETTGESLQRCEFVSELKRSAVTVVVRVFIRPKSLGGAGTLV